MLYIAYAVLWLLRFALGACVFSFLGVVVWRLPRRESVVKGRSHCPVCGRTLSAADRLRDRQRADAASGAHRTRRLRRR